MIDTLTIVMAGHSRPKDGVAEPVLGLAEGKTRGLAYVPGIHVFSYRGSKTDAEGRDKPDPDVTR